MDAQRLESLAREALAESKRNDCEFVAVREVAGGAWEVELMDVMLKREPFRVRVAAGAGDAVIKDSIRRAVAEHFSIESY